MSESKKLLASADIGDRFIFTLPKKIRNRLKIEVGQKIVFYKKADNYFIDTGGENIIGVSKISSIYSMTLPKDVRLSMNIHDSDITEELVIAFYEEADHKISIKIYTG